MKVEGYILLKGYRLLVIELLAMDSRAFSFEGVEVYQAARELVRDVYLLQQ